MMRLINSHFKLDDKPNDEGDGRFYMCEKIGVRVQLGNFNGDGGCELRRSTRHYIKPAIEIN